MLALEQRDRLKMAVSPRRVPPLNYVPFDNLCMQRPKAAPRRDFSLIYARLAQPKPSSILPNPSPRTACLTRLSRRTFLPRLGGLLRRARIFLFMRTEGRRGRGQREHFKC